MPTKDGYQRIVVWQPATGMAVDLCGPDALRLASPTTSERYFDAASGAQQAIGRNHRLDVQVVRGSRVSFLKLMQSQKEKVRVFGIGFKRHQMWYELGFHQMLDARQGFGGMAGAVLHLEQSKFEAGIYQAENILEGAPWTRAEALSDGGIYYLGYPSRSTYQGPRWQCLQGDTIPVDGVWAGPHALTFEVELPIGGATLRLSNVAGTITALDVDGLTLDSATSAAVTGTATLTLPDDTWTVRVTATASQEEPSLVVTHPGFCLEPRRGTLPEVPAPVAPHTFVFTSGFSIWTSAIVDFTSVATKIVNQTNGTGSGLQQALWKDPATGTIWVVFPADSSGTPGSGNLVIKRCLVDGSNLQTVIDTGLTFVNDGTCIGVDVRAGDGKIAYGRSNVIYMADMEGADTTAAAHNQTVIKSGVTQAYYRWHDTDTNLIYNLANPSVSAAILLIQVSDGSIIENTTPTYSASFIDMTSRPNAGDDARLVAGHGAALIQFTLDQLDAADQAFFPADGLDGAVETLSIDQVNDLLYYIDDGTMYTSPLDDLDPDNRTALGIPAESMNFMKLYPI